MPYSYSSIYTKQELLNEQDKSGVFLFLPIQEVLQKIDEGWLGEDVLLCKGMKIEGICKCLYKFELKLEPCTVRSPGVYELVHEESGSLFDSATRRCSHRI